MNNYHILTVKFLGATDTRGSRIKIHSDRFNSTKTIPYDYRHNSALAIAIEYLEEDGWHVVGTGEGKSHDYVIVSDFRGFKAVTLQPLVHALRQIKSDLKA